MFFVKALVLKSSKQDDFFRWNKPQSELFFVFLQTILIKKIMDNIGLGLQLMVVGMSAVFLILVIVIWGGKLLIKAVNKIAPEEVESSKKTSAAPAVVDSATMAVLQQVVTQITGGKGRIASAKKM